MFLQQKKYVNMSSQESCPNKELEWFQLLLMITALSSYYIILLLMSGQTTGSIHIKLEYSGDEFKGKSVIKRYLGIQIMSSFWIKWMDCI